MSAGGRNYTSFRRELDSLAENEAFRTLKTLANRSGNSVGFRGRQMVNLSSNDYLGLAADRELLSDFYSTLGAGGLVDSFGLGASSSRLLTGNHSLYDHLEREIGQAYGADKQVLVLNSGYHANIGILPALARRRDLILSDKLNHASIVDGVRLTRATLTRYRHCDYSHLAGILAKKRREHERVFIVTESVFSMDGDVADLRELARLRSEFDAFLYVDEAHAVGVRGRGGLGVAEEQGVLGDVDVLLGTFGKALAAQGAFAVVEAPLREYLINRMRSLIYTTALPPVILNWMLYVFRRVAGMADRRAAVSALAVQLRRELTTRGIATRGDSHIVPVVVGENGLAAAAARALQDQGWLVFPIRPPTVPPGTARLRLSLSATMDWQTIAQIPAVLSRCLSDRAGRAPGTTGEED